MAAAVSEQTAPWYARRVNLRALRLGKFTRIFLAITLPLIILYSFSIKPLWQFGWRVHFYGISNSFPVHTASGKWVAGGAWMRSREIRVYGVPGVEPKVVHGAVAGLTSLVDELGLNLTVREVPTPADVPAQYRAAQVLENGKSSFDFERFSRLRLDAHGGRYAELVVVNVPYRGAFWAVGMAECRTGLATVQTVRVPGTLTSLVRHECVHLLGYNRHDDFPYYVFGYPEDWWPDARQTLMHPKSFASDRLSPRARDAVLNYWRGATERVGMRSLRGVK